MRSHILPLKHLTHKDTPIRGGDRMERHRNEVVGECER